ncbi:kinesin-like protein KIF9 [Amia ocellicauda]|uniref:kinesin-like protein KIF9 n=1 Tax=Amia ocellicauda TaxID=2972642 RepID=UPI0034649639
MAPVYTVAFLRRFDSGSAASPARTGMSGSSCVNVFVRTRPTASFAQELIEFSPDGKTISLRARRDSRKAVVNNQQCDWTFRLDGILHNASQDEVYAAAARSVVLGALDGYNGTVMCFGQTGAGKTYTMTGATESYRQRGIIPRALQEVFQEVERRADHAVTVRLSFLEIYNETLQDLLSPGTGGSLAVVDEGGGGVHVRGLSVHLTHTEEEALDLLFEGEMNRTIAAHSLNRSSSRSHCILTVHIESRSRTLSDAKYVTSKLNLVDLAGSERLGKTGSEGLVLREATYINKSLSFLEQAVLALADRRRDHVPFRQSKLTHTLKDSLGGNCNTVLVANIYGEAAQIEETLSTLRFAGRMKCVRTDPAVNEHVDPVLQVKRLEKEIQLLRQELSIHDTLANRRGVSYEALTETHVAEIRRQVRQYLEGAADEIQIVNVRQIQEVFAQFKLILQQQEQQLEARLRQRFTLQERRRSAQGSASARRDPVEEQVGEVDGCGFGVGIAPSPHRAKPRRSNKEESSPVRREAPGSPVPGKDGERGSLSHLKPLKVSLKELQSQEPEPPGLEEPDAQSPPPDQPGSPDSPPPPAEAFEQFKAEQGSEINRILKENKAILVQRHRRLQELSDAVNQAKADIDRAAAALRGWRDSRQGQGELCGSLPASELVINQSNRQAVLYTAPHLFPGSSVL